MSFVNTIPFERNDFAFTSSALFLSVLMLASFGLVMVATSSIDFAASNYGDPWYFAKKQSVFLCLGLCVGAVVTMVPLRHWHQYSTYFLILGIALLVIVLIPGIGKVVNGSRRWLSFGPIGMQASEAAKFCLIIFFASCVFKARAPREPPNTKTLIFSFSASKTFSI